MPFHARRLVLGVTAALIAPLASLAVAHAELPPGWYATGCEMTTPAATEAAARKKCRKAGDVVEVTQKKPLYWVAAWQYRANSKADATKKCERAIKAKKSLAADQRDYLLKDCRTYVSAIYGPFKRKRATRGFDDADIYKYLNDDGRWVDKDAADPCFATGTLIATPDGDRPIESFEPGQTVLTWSPEAGRVVTAHVTRVKRRVAPSTLTLTLANGTRLDVTEHHPLWSATRQAWTHAADLRVGETLSVRDGDGLAPVAITAISGAPEAGHIDVWDLSIDTHESFFAGGVWVHNY